MTDADKVKIAFMTFTILIVLVHIFSAFGTVAGMIGREVTSAQLARASDLRTFLALSQLTGRFDQRLVQPASMVLFVSGIVLAVLEGYPLLGFLQGGAVNWLLAANVLVLSIVALIVLVFVPRGRQYAEVLQEAETRGEITPTLRATLSDPVVVWAHRWENLAVGLVILLMVVKPF